MAMKSFEKQISRSWQRMLSGRRLNIIDPSPLDIEIEDIALGISRVARWNGQTKGQNPISVAQHSVIVVEILRLSKKQIPVKWQLGALLHDAAEYIVGDVITPLKTLIGKQFSPIELRLQQTIHTRFSLPIIFPKTITKMIKRADRQTAFLEAIQLAGFSEDEARKIFPTPKNIPQYKIVPLPPNKAEKQFLTFFDDLFKKS